MAPVSPRGFRDALIGAFYGPSWRKVMSFRVLRRSAPWFAAAALVWLPAAVHALAPLGVSFRPGVGGLDVEMSFEVTGESSTVTVAFIEGLDGDRFLLQRLRMLHFKIGVRPRDVPRG